MLSLDEAADHLMNVRLSAQLGGPAGTLAPLPAFARELGLDEPVIPWHTLRGRIGELAGALGVAAGAVGKAARDVTLLAQTEVGEVRGGPRRRLDQHAPQAQPRRRDLRAGLRAAGARATSRPCWPRWCRSTSARPARGTANGARCATCWSPSARPPPGCATSLEGLEVDAGRMRANLGAREPDTGAAATPRRPRPGGPDDPPPHRDRPAGRAGAGPVQLARHDAGDVGPAGRGARRALPARPLRHARARPVGHAARAVLDRRRRRRRRRTARPPRRRARPRRRAQPRRHDRDVARASTRRSASTGSCCCAPRRSWARPRCGATAARPCASRAPRRSSTATMERWLTEDYRAHARHRAAGSRCSPASTTRATRTAARSSSAWTRPPAWRDRRAHAGHRRRAGPVDAAGRARRADRRRDPRRPPGGARPRRAPDQRRAAGRRSPR